MMIYREFMTFDTDIRDLDLEASNGWTPDCNGKLDYDPSIIRGSSRVWRDGDYMCTIYCGDTALARTEILKGGTVDEAKAKVEQWMDTKARIIHAAVVAALEAGE